MGIFDSFFQPPDISPITDAATNVLDTVTNRFSSIATNLNTASQRLANNGLPTGGVKTPGGQLSGQSVQFLDSNRDWRVRISSPNMALYRGSTGGGVLQPLNDTNGMVFPYTPTVTQTHTANYSSETPTHSNYPFNFYESSPLNEITVTGEFTAENTLEASYILACIHFCRSATKMFYGQDSNAGTPPPLLYLDGYGTHLLPHIPVVMTSCQFILEPDVDFIPATTMTATQQREASGTVTQAQNLGFDLGNLTASQFIASQQPSTMIPTKINMSVVLMPSYPRRRISNEWSLEKFARGELISNDPTKGGFV